MTLFPTPSAPATLAERIAALDARIADLTRLRDEAIAERGALRVEHQRDQDRAALAKLPKEIREMLRQPYPPRDAIRRLAARGLSNRDYLWTFYAKRLRALLETP